LPASAENWLPDRTNRSTSGTGKAEPATVTVTDVTSLIRTAWTVMLAAPVSVRVGLLQPAPAPTAAAASAASQA
jgi:hypothetical protein